MSFYSTEIHYGVAEDGSAPTPGPPQREILMASKSVTSKRFLSCSFIRIRSCRTVHMRRFLYPSCVAASRYWRVLVSVGCLF